MHGVMWYPLLVQVIEHVTGETLRDFYRRYYCPSNCCVAAVGDFDDPTAIAELIKDTFGSAVKCVPRLRHSHIYIRTPAALCHTTAPQPPSTPCLQLTSSPCSLFLSLSLFVCLCRSDPAVVPLPPLPAVPPHPDLRVGVYWDPEVSSASLSVECKRPESPILGTAKELKDNITSEMFHMAFTNRSHHTPHTRAAGLWIAPSTPCLTRCPVVLCVCVRLEKLAYRADPPFISARSSSNVSITVQGLGGASLQATAPESSVLMALHWSDTPPFTFRCR